MCHLSDTCVGILLTVLIKTLRHKVTARDYQFIITFIAFFSLDFSFFFYYFNTYYTRDI